MIVFKQSQMTQTSHPRGENKRAESVGEDARDREHQHERKLSRRPDHPGGDVAYGG